MEWVNEADDPKKRKGVPLRANILWGVFSVAMAAYLFVVLPNDPNVKAMKEEKATRAKNVAIAKSSGLPEQRPAAAAAEAIPDALPSYTDSDYAYLIREGENKNERRSLTRQGNIGCFEAEETYTGKFWRTGQVCWSANEMPVKLWGIFFGKGELKPGYAAGYRSYPLFRSGDANHRDKTLQDYPFLGIACMFSGFDIMKCWDRERLPLEIVKQVPIAKHR